jgi:transposase-like protein
MAKKTVRSPKTLVEAIRYFADPDRCLAFMVEIRWPKGIVCPTCDSREVRFLKTRRLWECKTAHTKRQFSVKVGTIFEDSALPLDTWLTAVWMITSAKNGVSSYEIARALGVTQKSAWFMLHRIRAAMRTGTFMKMKGRVEVDETYIGGAARFMHKDRKAARLRGKHGGMAGKVAVMGLLERHKKDDVSMVRAMVVPNPRRTALDPQVRANVAPGSTVITDALRSYDRLADDYTHKVIDHAETYVKGFVHTNGLENFWSLLKRAIKGTYVSVQPFQLARYVDEQVFRYNQRRDPSGDAGRFVKALSAITGRRLTYKALTGKTLGVSPA